MNDRVRFRYFNMLSFVVVFQGYYVINQDNQVVAVQRVVSPADCTVSQSNISIGPEGREVQPNATLISMPAMVSIL